MEIAIRDTIGSIVSRRNETIKKFSQAYDALMLSTEAVSRAYNNLFEKSTDFNYFNEESMKALRPLSIVDRKEYLSAARQMVLELSQIKQFMDTTAKAQLRSTLMSDPPICSEDNVVATLQQMLTDSGMMFRRGIAMAFSGLDKRFLSHDGWQLGSRIVIPNAIAEHSRHISFGNHKPADRLIDVERVFRTLSKLSPLDRGQTIVERLNKKIQWSSGPKLEPAPGEYEDGLFRVRWYKNRNLHVWFLDDELVWKANQLIAEYYGSPLPETRSNKRDYEHVPKTALVPGLAYFKTPDALADRLVSDAGLFDGCRVLEPSAGCGSLVRAVQRFSKELNIKVHVTAVEYDEQRANQLRALGVKVIQQDFLQLEPGEKFDVVVMNPPFDRGADITHVLHARQFLSERGKLQAIMSAGTVFRNDKSAQHFQRLLNFNREEQWNRDVHFHSFGAFKESGTNVNTIQVTLRAS
jgi:predicted RNA methylase